MKLNVGDKVWFSCYVEGEGPTICNVEITKPTKQDGYHYGKILTENGVTPTPYPDEIKTEYPDCEERLFPSQPYWNRQEAMKSLAKEVYEMIGELESRKARASHQWQLFLDAETKGGWER